MQMLLILLRGDSKGSVAIVLRTVNALGRRDAQRALLLSLTVTNLDLGSCMWL